eukprot:SAG11_NODE_1861_length_4155_cov_8.828156_4_plen_40_part_00
METSATVSATVLVEAAHAHTGHAQCKAISNQEQSQTWRD